MNANALFVICACLYGLLTKREVKMAGYWPSSIFACLWTETKSRSINTQKKNQGSQSQREFRFILPAHGARHIIRFLTMPTQTPFLSVRLRRLSRLRHRLPSSQCCVLGKRCCVPFYSTFSVLPIQPLSGKSRIFGVVA